MLFEVMTRRAQAQLEQKDGADFAYTIPGVSRFRVNVFRHIGGLGGVFRAIPSKALTLEQLNLPECGAQPLPRQQRADPRHRQDRLRQVDHARGDDRRHQPRARRATSSRSRTRSSSCTRARTASSSQREVGLHSPSFAEALHSALREDPDIVLVGELRDLETMSIAVTAAEMGILVMGTLHTNGAAATVDRIVNAFPADKQGHVRTMLSTSLRGVISQQLIPRADKRGRVAALEILINTPAVSNLIRQGKLDQLENAMQSGGAHGMRIMDSAIQELLDKGVINGRAAYEKAISKQRFEQFKDMRLKRTLRHVPQRDRWHHVRSFPPTGSFA